MHMSIAGYSADDGHPTGCLPRAQPGKRNYRPSICRPAISGRRPLKPKRRLIVADDDSSILELLQMILEDEGYEVRAFSSPVLATREALAHPPDALIVDMMMPGMTGLQVVDTLKADRRTSHVPVLVCSAYYGDLRRMIQRNGHDGVRYLRKPFQLDELLQLVDGMISPERAVAPKLGNATANGRSQRPREHWDLTSPSNLSASNLARTAPAADNQS
jgi:CheY-like chemotaxis protein